MRLVRENKRVICRLMARRLVRSGRITAEMTDSRENRTQSSWNCGRQMFQLMVPWLLSAVRIRTFLLEVKVKMM